MGVQNSGRLSNTMSDWMRDIEKRLMHEERRPSVRPANELVGHGIRAYSVQVDDWNSDGPIVNGYFHSNLNQVVNSPDDTLNWMGVVQSNPIGQGSQRVWDYIDISSLPDPNPSYFSRSFVTNPDGTRTYTPWVESTGGSEGGGEIPSTLPPSGPAGGDLDGTYPNPTLNPATKSAMMLDVLDESNLMVADASVMNFAGAGVTVTRSGEGAALVTIPGGGGAGGGPLDNWIGIANGGCSFDGSNIPGAVVTVVSYGPADKFMVIGTADLALQIATNAAATIDLVVDGAAAGGQIIWIVPSGTPLGTRSTNTQNWVVSGLAAGNHTIGLRTGSIGPPYNMIISNAYHTRIQVTRLTGVKGDTGLTGPQGPAGVIGPQGPTGPKGDKGDKGDQGIPGIPGSALPLDTYQGSATGETILTTTVQDIPGCTFNVTSASTVDKFFVIATMDMYVVVNSNSTAVVNLYVDGVVDSTAAGLQYLANSFGRQTVEQHWIITGLAPGDHAMKLAGALSAAGGDIRVEPHTRLTAMRLIGSKGDLGPVGPPGPQGPQGADSTVPGPPGPSGAAAVTMRRTTSTGQTVPAMAYPPALETVQEDVGGGITYDATTHKWTVHQDGTYLLACGWEFIGTGDPGSPRDAIIVVNLLNVAISAAHTGGGPQSIAPTVSTTKRLVAGDLVQFNTYVPYSLPLSNSVGHNWASITKIDGVKGDAGANSTVPGPAGPAGPTGPQGADSTVPGPQGPVGATGPVGPQGVKGDPGATGIQGAPGGDGEDGTIWTSGDGPPVPVFDGSNNPGDFYLDESTGDIYRWDNDAGWVLETNITGPAGATGPAGPTGPKGDVGATGQTGPQGPAGATGAQGPKGDTGDSGPAGADSTVPGPAGPAGATGAQGPKGDTGAEGPQGSAGTDGSVWYSSNPTHPDPPVPGQKEGDYFLYENSGDVFRFTGGSWVYEGSILGPAGPPGETGPAGPASTVPGPAGPTGPAGATGADSTVPGPAGPAGPKGDTGAAGATGAAGPTGPIGPTGPEGVAGPIGATGPQGPTGPASTVPGPPGATGPAGPAGAAGVAGPAGPAGPTGPKGDTGATGPPGAGGVPSPNPPIRRLFTSTGSWTKPANLDYVIVEVVGGGGGGGASTATTAGAHSQGMGGGAGAYVRKQYPASALGATEAISIGGGGVYTIGGAGTAGGESTFSTSAATKIQASGGGGGPILGNTSLGYGGQGAPGGGSTTTIQDLTIAGDQGGVGWGDGVYCYSGEGASSFFGPGGTGISGLAGGSNTINGNYGIGYGSGGGGSISTGAANVGAGGIGAQGCVVVTEFYMAAGAKGDPGPPGIPGQGYRPTALCATTADITPWPPSGGKTIDGIDMYPGSDLLPAPRVLVRAQANAVQNGIWEVNSGPWSRAPDANTSLTVAATEVGVQSGNAYGGTRWWTNFRSTDVLGVTPVYWEQQHNVPDTGFQYIVNNPGWASGWWDYYNTDPAWEHVKYCKIGNIVYVQGMGQQFSGGTSPANSIMWTMPVGYRPISQLIVQVQYDYLQSFRVDVRPNGQVVMGPGIAHGTWFAMSFNYFVN